MCLQIQTSKLLFWRIQTSKPVHFELLKNYCEIIQTHPCYHDDPPSCTELVTKTTHPRVQNLLPWRPTLVYRTCCHDDPPLCTALVTMTTHPCVQNLLPWRPTLVYRTCYHGDVICHIYFQGTVNPLSQQLERLLLRPHSLSTSTCRVLTLTAQSRYVVRCQVRGQVIADRVTVGKLGNSCGTGKTATYWSLISDEFVPIFNFQGLGRFTVDFYPSLEYFFNCFGNVSLSIISMEVFLWFYIFISDLIICLLPSSLEFVSTPCPKSESDKIKVGVATPSKNVYNPTKLACPYMVIRLKLSQFRWNFVWNINCG